LPLGEWHPSAAERTTTIPANQMDAHQLHRIRRYNIGMLVATGLAAVVLGSIVYESWAQGISYFVGSFLGGLIICWPVAWGFTRRPERKNFRASITLSLALAATLGVNTRTVLVAMDAREARKILADVAGPADLERTLSKNSDNRVLALMRFGAEAAREARDELEQLFNNVKPPELEAPIAYNGVQLSDLETYRRAFKIAEGNALAAASQVDFVLAREKARLDSYLKANRFDDDFRRSALKGLAPTR
jgi:hypothetical protein